MSSSPEIIVTGGKVEELLKELRNHGIPYTLKQFTKRKAGRQVTFYEIYFDEPYHCKRFYKRQIGMWISINFYAVYRDREVLFTFVTSKDALRGKIYVTRIRNEV